MDEQVQVFKDKQAYKATHAEAREIAVAYVEANSEAFELLFGSKTHDELVHLVTAYRRAGLPEDSAKVEMYLAAKFEPQVIGGSAAVRVRPDWRNG